MIESEKGLQVFGGEVDNSIVIKPTDLSPLRLTVVAAFNDNTYAIRTWSFAVDRTTVQATLVDVPEDRIQILRGSTYKLWPVAYLAAPHQNILDVSSLATYSASPLNIVSLASDGTVKALAPGTAKVVVRYKGKDDAVDVFVK